MIWLCWQSRIISLSWHLGGFCIPWTLFASLLFKNKLSLIWFSCNVKLVFYITWWMKFLFGNGWCAVLLSQIIFPVTPPNDALASSAQSLLANASYNLYFLFSVVLQNKAKQRVQQPIKMPSAYKHNQLSAIAFYIRQHHIAEPWIIGYSRPTLLPDTKWHLCILVIAFTQIWYDVNSKTIIQPS